MNNNFNKKNIFYIIIEFIHSSSLTYIVEKTSVTFSMKPDLSINFKNRTIML